MSIWRGQSINIVTLNFVRPVVLVASIVIFSQTAWSQALPEQELEQTTPASARSWDVTLGIGPSERPVYLGAKHYHVDPFFFGSVTYRNLSLGPAGLGTNFINSGGFRVGPVVGYEDGRDSNGDPHLHGLHNIQSSIMAGGFVAYRLGAFELNGTFRQAVIHSNNGLIGRVQLDYLGSLFAKRLTFRVGPEVDLGDGRYEKTWFGISDHQSAASGLPPFFPHGGVVDAGVHAIINYRYSDRIVLRAIGDIRQFEGGVNQSPIIETKTQGFIGIGIGYHFKFD
jgi:MipA family protein